jgi:hypothetical protein
MIEAPDLWPDMDRSTPTAMAWVDLWELLYAAGDWVPMGEAVAHVLGLNPTVKRTTLDTKIRAARSAHLVQRRGGYSHKTGKDTRELRLHPAASA